MNSKPCAVITGSTRGIGLSIAHELAERGYIPILNFRSDPTAAERALVRVRGICADAIAVQADVSTENGVQDLFAAASSRGSIDILINNVGPFLYKPFLETSIKEWQGILSSNLLSTVLCCQQALPIMRERQQGTIVNIAMLHADQIRSRPHTLVYAIAKAGIIHLTQTLARTEGRYGIRVNALGPGFIEGGEYTHPEHAGQSALGQLGTPEDVAKAVAFLVSDAAKYISGVLLNVDGGALL